MAAEQAMEMIGVAEAAAFRDVGDGEVGGVEQARGDAHARGGEQGDEGAVAEFAHHVGGAVRREAEMRGEVGEAEFAGAAVVEEIEDLPAAVAGGGFGPWAVRVRMGQLAEAGGELAQTFEGEAGVLGAPTRRQAGVAAEGLWRRRRIGLDQVIGAGGAWQALAGEQDQGQTAAEQVRDHRFGEAGVADQDAAGGFGGEQRAQAVDFPGDAAVVVRSGLHRPA